MHKRIMFRCMAHSDAIEKYISKKIEKINKFFKREPLLVFVDIVLEPCRQKHMYKIACKIDSAHYHKAIHNQGVDMYMIIDKTVRTIIKDIARKKEKHHHDSHVTYA